MSTLVDAVAALVARAVQLGADERTAAELQGRFERPLRVVIAGRLKAGKSTLLNALVGERLAATDASECTRIVTWYRQGTGYAVEAEFEDGRRPVRFDRNGRLELYLDEMDPDRILTLTVEWPSRRLGRYTLIDTVGLDSARVDAAAGTRAVAEQADVTVYLMRHLHVRDTKFLEAFAGSAEALPAIGVLSRADEIGGGDLDAMEVAAGVAAAYSTDHRIVARTETVVPVAGLLAEAAVTLTEEEYGVLVRAAGDDESALASVDRFVLAAGPGDEDSRHAVLARLGLFGVRRSVVAIRRGEVASATELAALLAETSGIDRLVQVLEDRFGGRAAVFKARSVLRELRRIAGAERLPKLLAEVERVEATAPELAELRLGQLLTSADVTLDEDDYRFADALAAGESPLDAARVTAATDLVEVIERWRRLAADPLLDAGTKEAGEVVVRILERFYGEAGGS